MIRVGRFVIHDENAGIDAEATDGALCYGHVESWTRGTQTLFCIRGDTPLYVQRAMARVAERRGWRWYYWHCRFPRTPAEYRAATAACDDYFARHWGRWHHNAGGADKRRQAELIHTP